MLSRYDYAKRGWQLGCDSLVRLPNFRKVRPIAAARNPQILRVDYLCVKCNQNHLALMTTTELDWDPIGEAPPIYYDLDSKKNTWDSGLFIKHHQKIILEGAWPLEMSCSGCGKTPSWPSLLREVRPLTEEKCLLFYLCSKCQRPNYAEKQTSKLLIY